MSYCAQGRLFTFEDIFNENDDELIGGLVSKRKGRRNRYVVSKREFAQGCRDKAS